MALIGAKTQIIPNTKADSIHKEVWKASYKVFTYGGHRYVQIDTYGTDTRQDRDQPSQILQIEWNQFVTLFGGILEQLGIDSQQLCKLKVLEGLGESENLDKEL